MALWVCRRCTAAYAPESPACPECGSTEYDDQGVLEMAKISAGQGPSYTEQELADNPDLVPGLTSPAREDDKPHENPGAPIDGVGSGEGGSPIPGAPSTGREVLSERGESDVDQGDQDAEEYEPGDYYANDVIAYLEQCRVENNTAEYDRVVAAERAGKNRSSIINH